MFWVRKQLMPPFVCELGRKTKTQKHKALRSRDGPLAGGRTSTGTAGGVAGITDSVPVAASVPPGGGPAGRDGSSSLPREAAHRTG